MWGWPEPYIYGVYTVYISVYTVFFGREKKIRSYTVCIYAVLANPINDAKLLLPLGQVGEATRGQAGRSNSLL